MNICIKTMILNHYYYNIDENRKTYENDYCDSQMLGHS